MTVKLNINKNTKNESSDTRSNNGNYKLEMLVIA